MSVSAEVYWENELFPNLRRIVSPISKSEFVQGITDNTGLAFKHQIQQRITSEGEFLKLGFETFAPDWFPKVEVDQIYTFPVNMVVMAELALQNFGLVVRNFRECAETEVQKSREFNFGMARILGRVAKIHEQDQSGLSVVQYITDNLEEIEANPWGDVTPMAESLLRLGGERYLLYYHYIHS